MIARFYMVEQAIFQCEQKPTGTFLKGTYVIILCKIAIFNNPKRPAK
jgi:hypothetical protein